jgi:hypothetical protein
VIKDMTISLLDVARVMFPHSAVSVHHRKTGETFDGLLSGPLRASRGQSMREMGTSDDVTGIVRIYAADADRVQVQNGDEIVIIQNGVEHSRRVVDLRPEQSGGTMGVEYGDQFAP